MIVRFSGFSRFSRGRSLERLARKICAAVPKLRRRGEINFILVSDAKLRKLHKDFLDDPSPTDVITFQYPARKPSKTDPDPAFGDVYISLGAALRAARAGRYSPRQELAFLAAHGLLHLAGWDDRSPRDRDRMLALQRKLLLKFCPSLCPPR